MQSLWKFNPIKSLISHTRNTRQLSMRGAKNHNYDYDLVVIGAGSGGVRAARISGAHGAKVALIEPSFHHGPPHFSAIGGTCVNVGCVPKKLFRYGSLYQGYQEDCKGFGWNSQEMTHDWKTLNENKNKEINRLNEIYVKMLRNAGVDLIEGFGTLADKNNVSIFDSNNKEKEIKSVSAETIMLCTGGWPHIPDIPGKEFGITSNEAFYLENKPQKVVVVGGGYIGVEFAGIFEGYGCEVDFVHRGDLFLRGFDMDIRKHLLQQMKLLKINTIFNTNVIKIEKTAEGRLKAFYDNDTSTVCDQVMFATGRTPRTDFLNLDRVGVKLTSSGAIEVDEFSKSSVDNIYAVGDVTNRMDLTPVALYEGHSFADTMYGGKSRPVEYENIASAVFSHPEIGTVGLTEEAAIKKYQRVSIFTSSFTPLKDRMTGKIDRKDFMKIVVDDDTDRVLGVHICGGEAAEITQGVAIAVKMGAKKSDFDATIGIHPTAGEELVTMRTATRHYDGGNLKQGPRL
eukprot:snap_masked-scaffold_47-processed-gene-0.21-mRNA-1 protein AED:0.02 eAED:0.02 QI:339/1/1/1/0.66/0.5/4/57/511